MDILSQYVLKYPQPQNILDIFAGEWSSTMPRPDLKSTPGVAALFEDPRLAWAESVFGGVQGARVLELGPLEGAHSYMLQNMGAQHVHAIEANTRAFLKCLCIKEIFDLDKVKFELGDFMLFLEQTQDRFEVIIASGVLYHMIDPLSLLKHIADKTKKVYLWTHYYDHDIVTSTPHLKHKFNAPTEVEYLGQKYLLCEQSYKDALNWEGFCGGPKNISKWLTRDSLLSSLKNFGFNRIEVNFENPNHSNGPSLSLCALK